MHLIQGDKPIAVLVELLERCNQVVLDHRGLWNKTTAAAWTQGQSGCVVDRPGRVHVVDGMDTFMFKARAAIFGENLGRPFESKAQPRAKAQGRAVGTRRNRCMIRGMMTLRNGCKGQSEETQRPLPRTHRHYKCRVARRDGKCRAQNYHAPTPGSMARSGRAEDR